MNNPFGLVYEDAFNKATGTDDKELCLIEGASHIRTYWVKEYVNKAVSKLDTFFKHRLTGSIRIGAGESQAFRFFAETATTLLKEHPDVQLHITSGDTQDLMDELDNGLIDFALIFSDFDREKYHSFQLPAVDRFGVLMRRDNPLASKPEIQMSELAGVPMMISRASQSHWENARETGSLKVIGTYNLLFNASLLVEAGACCALGFEKLINTTGDSTLCFRPLAGQGETTGTLIWKKYQTFAPAVQLFIDQIRSFDPQ